MKTVLLNAAFLSLSVSSFAFCQQPTPEAPKDPNPSSRFGTNKKTSAFLTGEVVFFKPLMNEYAQANTNTGTTSGTTYTYFNYNFQPGLRVALGCNTPYDGWDLVLTYTGLRYNHSNTYANSVLQPAYINLPLTGQINYIYYYDQADLDLGRMFEVSQKLSLRPHFGLRALWLTQKASASPLYYNQEFSSITRYKGTLIGAVAGFDSLWMLTKQFYVYANLGLTTLVNSQKATYTSSNVATSTNLLLNQTNYGSKIVNGLDFALGLRWDRNFKNDDYHIGINLGYEHHSLINVNSPLDLIIGQSDALYQNQDTDFTLEGVAAGLRFDF
jgi:hypothetical protein